MPSESSSPSTLTKCKTHNGAPTKERRKVSDGETRGFSERKSLPPLNFLSRKKEGLRFSNSALIFTQWAINTN